MRFDLVGEPIAQKRAKFFLRGKIPTAFDPSKPDKKKVQASMNAELNRALNSQNKAIAMEASSLASAKSFKIILLFWFGIPESWSKKKKKEMVNAFHVSKPDVDNLIKFYLDCATGIIWADDCLVSEIVAVKRYGIKGGVTMIVTPQKKQDSEQPVVNLEVQHEAESFDSNIVCGHEQLHLFSKFDPL